MKGLHMVTFILLIVGGLNWGLEAFGWGIGRFLPSGIAMIIYILVGISAIVELVGHKKCCTDCKAKGGAATAAPTMPMQSNDGGSNGGNEGGSGM